MTYLLDTNACIRYLNGKSPSIRDRLAIVEPGEVVLCSVVKAELLYGAVKSGRPIENLERHQRFMSGFHSFPFDDRAAGTYGELRAELERIGQPIGPNDLMIASIALSNGLVLVTHNLREFSRVQGLYVEDWETA